MKIIVLCCLLTLASSEMIKVGNFPTRHHKVDGAVYIHNDTTIIVKNFNYDGLGPDAFFMVGNTATPAPGGVALPFPFKGKFYDYESNEIPVLERFQNGEIVLMLPSDKKVTDFEWISVWCRDFNINFGEVYFSKRTDLPSPIADQNNALDENHHAGHKYDADAESESEAESEAESEGESEAESYSHGNAVTSSLVLLTVVLFNM